MSESFVPEGFEPPRTLVTVEFRLEPLGPQHNASDLAAWSSSIDHIRATPGYPDGRWPPVGGMTAEENLADLTRHAADFEARTGFTFTVLAPEVRGAAGAADEAADEGADEGAHEGAPGEVIGCVYLYPSSEPEHDVEVQSWVRADHAELDGPLADAVAEWLAANWPWTRPDRHGR